MPLSVNFVVAGIRSPRAKYPGLGERVARQNKIRCIAQIDSYLAGRCDRDFDR
jgi:hypothetical protein